MYAQPVIKEIKNGYLIEGLVDENGIMYKEHYLTYEQAIAAKQKHLESGRYQ